jgi:hypothetical protein
MEESHNKPESEMPMSMLRYKLGHQLVATSPSRPKKPVAIPGHIHSMKSPYAVAQMAVEKSTRRENARTATKTKEKRLILQAFGLPVQG